MVKFLVENDTDLNAANTDKKALIRLYVNDTLEKHIVLNMNNINANNKLINNYNK